MLSVGANFDNVVNLQEHLRTYIWNYITMWTEDGHRLFQSIGMLGGHVIADNVQSVQYEQEEFNLTFDEV